VGTDLLEDAFGAESGSAFGAESGGGTTDQACGGAGQV
jgi:hypothetical protein